MKYLLRPLFFLTILTLTGCLDENSKDSLDEQHTYTTERDVYVNAVATLYNYIGSDKDSEGLQGTYRGVYDYNTFTTDEAIIPVRGGDWYDGGFWADLYTHNWAEDSKPLYDTWKYLYKVIVFSNDALTTIDKHKQLLTEEQYKAYRAEVRAIRALYYYYLMDMFGNIPLVTTAGESTENAEQASRPEVYRFIVKELQEVTPLLPKGHSNLLGKNYGRVTRSVANFLLAKLMLNGEVYSDADWTDNQQPNGKQTYFTINGQQMNIWQACKYYCDKVTADGFTLATNYLSNFSVNNENSPENIFTIPLDKHLYKNQFQYLFRSRHYSHGGAFGTSSENGACATISTVKTFGNGTSNVDKRYAYNLYSDTVRVDGNIIYLENGKPLVYMPLAVELNLTNSPYIKTAGARMAKYEVDRTAFNDGKSPDNDIVLFRYADVLLMKAEAAVRNGENGNTELNLVRSRSGMGNRTATLDNILAERLMELMWEGWRRNDLIRFNRFHQSYDLRTAPETEADRHTIVFPIPSRALDLNEKLKQNKGYKR
ncbi:RagB/SusD family nutrient uptake outer membrane protein [Prevotella melaninogenica]|uniref:RagB/SusD family nutrient uptake outer membrane protein n=1 Tax=Prevotella melaninogenica TaxID=28132 RepID=UPI001BA58085|nr:RagB/SusD family nutrient uptake outer membrane protein [Prevotella melaninogenica]QUB61860.1 RagB/SusD family nutrient uptake outer membrane protein [Prevotella melaninogenica]